MNGLKRLLEVYALSVLTIVILVLLLLNSSRFFLRADLTESGMFTISRVSRNLISEIPEEMTITYYISAPLKRYSPVPSHIEDVLTEYAAFGRGSVHIKSMDPAGADAGDPIGRYGLTPQRLQVVDGEEKSTALVYSGIVVEYLDRFEVIPFIFKLETIEYELSSAIKRLLENERKTIGILIGNESKRADADYRTLTERLSRSFGVRMLSPGEDIPAEVSALFVLGNRDLDEYAFFPLDQYLMRGGRALLAVDALDVDVDLNFAVERSEDSPLLRFLDLNGIHVRQALLLDENSKSIPVARRQGDVIINVREKYPHWVSVTAENASPENPVTQRFQGLDLLWPCPLDIAGSERLRVMPVLKSSTHAWLMENYYSTNPDDSETFLLQAERSKKQYTLAVAAGGTFVSYYDGKPLPSRPGVRNSWENIVAESSETEILVVGDSDFASDLIRYSGSPYNMLFLENAAFWLTNDGELLGIKTRSIRDLRLNRIENPEEKRAVIFTAEILNIFLIPFFVILAGLLNAVLRKEKRKLRGEAKLPQNVSDGGIR